MTDSETVETNSWDRFWFQPGSIQDVARIRGMLCALTAMYFLSAWSDAAFWFQTSGPFSAANTAQFWQTAGLDREATWNFSPLFLTDSIWIYHGYLIVGVALSMMVMVGRGGRIATWCLWMLLVGWANRAMILSGLTETLLSLGLFAAAIAPPASAWGRTRSGNPEPDEQHKQDGAEQHWSARFSMRLLAVQITIIGLLTCATMLAGRVWFNGEGAYALAAPAEDRTIDWTGEGSWLTFPLMYEPLTHLLVILLPLGFALSWRPSTRRYGVMMLWAWCVVVGLLGSLWLYAATFAVMTLAIRPACTRRS